jgi:hypothetical protein
MPVVEKVKRPPIDPTASVPVESAPDDISIEKPKARKPPTEAMREAGRANLEKGRLALQAKRDAAKASKPADPKPVAKAPVAQIEATPKTRSKKVIYQEESDSEDEVIIVKKKKKPKKKIIYEESSDDEPIVVKKKSTAPVERPPSPPRVIQQPMSVLRWI